MYIKDSVRSRERNCTTDAGAAVLLGEFVKTELDEFADLRLVVRIGCLVVTMGDDAAYSTGIVPQMGRYAGDGRAFHLEIGHLQIAEAEAFKCIEHIRHSKRHTENTSLRAIET